MARLQLAALYGGTTGPLLYVGQFRSVSYMIKHLAPNTHVNVHVITEDNQEHVHKCEKNGTFKLKIKNALYVKFVASSPTEALFCALLA